MAEPLGAGRRRTQHEPIIEIEEGNTVRTASAAVVLVAALALSACTASAASTPAPPNGDGEVSGPAGGITVTGRGVASGIPDVVRVTVGVSVERDDVQSALDDANTATEAVIAALGDNGVGESDRQTQQFSLNPVHDQQGDTPTITGYQVANTVEATVRDIDTLGDVLSAAAAAGGDDATIWGVSFDLEEDGTQIAAAREAAIDDARATAQQYADLTGVTLGEPIGITDATISSPLRAQAEMDGADTAQDMALADVPIEPGEQDVVVSVTVRWSVD